jgi:hypothetical protein
VYCIVALFKREGDRVIRTKVLEGAIESNDRRRIKFK